MAYYYLIIKNITIILKILKLSPNRTVSINSKLTCLMLGLTETHHTMLERTRSHSRSLTLTLCCDMNGHAYDWWLLSYKCLCLCVCCVACFFAVGTAQCARTHRVENQFAMELWAMRYNSVLLRILWRLDAERLSRVFLISRHQK